MTCQGCIDFENDMGGENQLAHMDGCLYIDEEGDYSTPIEISPELKEILDKVNLDKKGNNVKAIHHEFNTQYQITNVFIDASRNRDYKKMKQFLNEGFNINTSSPNYYDKDCSLINLHFSALHWAVQDDDPIIFCWLLQHGASIETPSYYKCGYVYEFIEEGSDVYYCYKNICIPSLKFRSFYSFKLAYSRGEMKLNKKDLFNRFYCLNLNQINKLTPNQLLEKVFVYIEEEYEMYAYFHDEIDLKREFQLIRDFIATKKVF
jgi:hypothetical protein